MRSFISYRKALLSPVNNNHGVTLPEILVYMVIAGMLLATGVMAFMGQNSSYNRQDVVAEIQQNLRGATESISADIRLAGMGITEGSSTDEPFEIANATVLAVNYRDLNEDELVTVTYTHDGVNDLLLRQETRDGVVSPPTVLAENIEELRFEYMFNNDPPPQEDWQWRMDDADINDRNALPAIIAPKNLGDARELIRAVKIVLLGAARSSAFNPTDTITYQPPLEATTGAPVSWIPDAGTGYKQILSTIVQCRNSLEPI